MPIAEIQFNRGIQPPAKIGTVILKPTNENKLSYAQNVDIQTDEYGGRVILPGPALVTLTNNSELTGVAWLRQFFGLSTSPLGYLYVGEGLLGNTNRIRRIVDVEAGETPSLDASNSLTVTHTAHSNVVLEDLG